MTLVKTHSSYKIDSVNITGPSKDSNASYFTHNCRARIPSESLRSQSSEYLSSKTLALYQAPKIRSPRSFSSSIHDGGSIKSSLSLPTRPKTSSDEWKIGMAPKPLSKTFHGSGLKISAESQRPSRRSWKWVWVFEGKWIKHESLEPIQLQKQKLISKRLTKSPSIQENNRPNRYNIQEDPSSSKGELVPGVASSGVASPDKITPRLSAISREGRSSSRASQASNKLLRGFQYMSPTYPHFRSPTGEPEGLFCKTKRGIGVGQVGKSKDDLSNLAQQSVEELPSRTMTTLKGATSALDRAQLKGSTHQNMNFSAGGYSPSASSQRSGRQIGVASWHRRNSQDSTWSVTSSIREVLRGKTPVVTPNPEMQYGGHKGKKYAKVDITRKDDPNFLPSEAVQVYTPPTSAGTASTYSRGFFLDLSPSTNDQRLSVTSDDRKSALSRAPRTAVTAQITSRRKREWWDEMEISLIRDALGVRGRLGPSGFEWNTPEHLPNSPLCPLYQKERHGDVGNSNGICVYHGRKWSFGGSGEQVLSD